MLKVLETHMCMDVDVVLYDHAQVVRQIYFMGRT